MIVSAFLYTVSGIIGLATLPLLLLDDMVINPSIVAGIAQVNAWSANIYALVPIEHFVVCSGILIVWEKWWLIYQGIRWVIQKIPSIN